MGVSWLLLLMTLLLHAVSAVLQWHAMWRYGASCACAEGPPTVPVARWAHVTRRVDRPIPIPINKKPGLNTIRHLLHACMSHAVMKGTGVCPVVVGVVAPKAVAHWHLRACLWRLAHDMIMTMAPYLTLKQFVSMTLLASRVISRSVSRRLHQRQPVCSDQWGPAARQVRRRLCLDQR